MYENYFSVFQRESFAWLGVSFGDFSGPLRSVFSSLWGSSISQILLVLVWMGLGELPKRLSIKLEICLVIRALYRALGWHLAHRRRRRTIMKHSGARWEKAEATVYLDPNISQTFKSLSGCHWGLEPNRCLYFQAGHKWKEANGLDRDGQRIRFCSRRDCLSN